jgi:hypothetical protein
MYIHVCVCFSCMTLDFKRQNFALVGIFETSI